MWNLRDWCKLQVQARGLLGEPFELVLPEFVFVMSSAPVDVLFTELQHAVDQTGEFVRHGGDGFGSAEFSAEPAEVCAQRTLASHQAPCRHSQCGGRSVHYVSGTAFEDLPAADTIVGTQTEPRGETLFRLPSVHIHSHFGDHSLGGPNVHAIPKSLDPSTLADSHIVEDDLDQGVGL
jgi:hypothetical protein